MSLFVPASERIKCKKEKSLDQLAIRNVQLMQTIKRAIRSWTKQECVQEGFMDNRVTTVEMGNLKVIYLQNDTQSVKQFIQKQGVKLSECEYKLQQIENGFIVLAPQCDDLIDMVDLDVKMQERIILENKTNVEVENMRKFEHFVEEFHKYCFYVYPVLLSMLTGYIIYFNLLVFGDVFTWVIRNMVNIPGHISFLMLMLPQHRRCLRMTLNLYFQIPWKQAWHIENLENYNGFTPTPELFVDLS
jgi:hypothetical protein